MNSIPGLLETVIILDGQLKKIESPFVIKLMKQNK